MNKRTVKVFAPATIANVGPGFDVLGIAIEQPGDTVIAKSTDECDFKFTLKANGHDLPANDDNVAAHVARLIIADFKPDFGIALTLEKNMPIGSGLGSSGASAAASVYAMNLLLDTGLSKMEMIHYAASGEKLASGSAHADNVAPSLLGGVCLISSYSPLKVLQLPYQNEFYWVVAHPELMIETKMARELLPKTMSITLATEQNANLAALITGLRLGDASIIASALKDNFAEPVRAPLIPGFQQIKKSVLEAGAIGFSISGSGPSLFAIAANKKSADELAEVFIKSFRRYTNVGCQVYSSKINDRGAYEI